MKKNLKLFDFDGTLVYTPGPTTMVGPLPALELYDLHLEQTGKPKRKWSGWWGRIETLTPPIFGERNENGEFSAPEDLLNKDLAALHAEYVQDSENLCVLATGRHMKMKDPQNPEQHMVKTILDYYGIHFDHYHYVVGGMPTLTFKCNVIEAYLRQHPTIEHVEIWEDREAHFSKFWEMVKWLKKQERIKDGFVHLVLPPEQRAA